MEESNSRPIIIKRKKVIAGDGHHGGAWKVAYADFVTAMMAFFMLMWLLNATTEQQRKGIADYFSPTIPINRISGGGSGAFGGDSIFSENTLAQSGTGINQPTLGNNPLQSEDNSENAAAKAAETAALEEIEDILFGSGGESLLSDNALRHIVTRLTDEGLVIEIYDLPDSSLFDGATATPNPVLNEVGVTVGRLLRNLENSVAIKGHVRARTVLLLDNPVWELSTKRADAMRLAMQNGGLDGQRFRRLTGAADRDPAAVDPTAPRNNRLEIIVIRSDP